MVYETYLPRSGEWHERKRIRCIQKYKCEEKRKAVELWRKRINALSISQRQFADSIGIKSPRISEYTRFLIEPKDAVFIRIEAAIERLENQSKY